MQSNSNLQVHVYFLLARTDSPHFLISNGEERDQTNEGEIAHLAELLVQTGWNRKWNWGRLVTVSALGSRQRLVFQTVVYGLLKTWLFLVHLTSLCLVPGAIVS